jgi:hypothetical protein
MPCKVYTSGGAVFDVVEGYEQILTKLQQAGASPYVFESMLNDEDRRVVVVNQYVVAVEETNF